MVGANAVGGVDRVMMGHLALSWKVMLVVQPLPTIFTRQSLFFKWKSYDWKAAAVAFTKESNAIFLILFQPLVF